MFSWQINAEREVNVSEESVWNSWKNVEQWPSWDSSLEWSRLNGPFHEGVQGVLKPKGWFASNFTVTKVIPFKECVDTSYLPFTRVVFTHQMERLSSNQLKIIHNLRVKGLLACILWFTMRLQLKKSIPQALDNLIHKLSK